MKVLLIAPYVNLNFDRPAVNYNREDFYPTFGRFNTPIYELSINFNDREIFLNFGVLPELLEASLSMANTKAIIGNDIFSHFSLIFHYANKKIYIKHL